MQFLHRFVPLFLQLKTYTKPKFYKDVFAGLTVGTVLIPQGLAYGLMAGVNPIYGLYAGFIPLFIYALFGSSTKLSIGPVAISAILIFDGVRKIADPMSGEYLALVIALGLFIGVLQIVLSFLKLGIVANFLSRPVIAGFISAAVIIIVGTQLKDALGFAIPIFPNTFEVYAFAVKNLGDVQWISVVIFVTAILIISLFQKFSPKVPGPFIAVALSIVVCYIFRLDRVGLDIVGRIPSGLPDMVFPDITFQNLQLLLPTIFTVTLIGMVESISIAKTMESKYKDHHVNTNQELFALGISKVIGSLFSSIPSSGSFSRSAINGNSGSTTNISSIVTFILMAFALLFFMPLFTYLPKSVLAAIILISVFSLFDYKEAINLWKTHKQDLAMMLTTFAMTLIFGIETGVFSGVLLSILMVLYKSSRPHMAVLGNIPGTHYYRNMERYQKAEGFDLGVIIRFDNQLYFGNADFFKEGMLDIINQQEKDLKYVILKAQNIYDIDSSGIHKLRELDNYLKDNNIELHLCGAIGPVRDILYKSGLLNEEDKHHASVHDAVNYINSKNTDELKKRPVDPFQHGEG